MGAAELGSVTVGIELTMLLGTNLKPAMHAVEYEL